MSGKRTSLGQRFFLKTAYKVADKARDDLWSMGLHATPLRLVMLQILKESGERFEANALYSCARIHVPDLSWAVFCQTLQTLKDAGLVTQEGFDAYPKADKVRNNGQETPGYQDRERSKHVQPNHSFGSGD